MDEPKSSLIALGILLSFLILLFYLQSLLKMPLVIMTHILNIDYILLQLNEALEDLINDQASKTLQRMKGIDNGSSRFIQETSNIQLQIR